MARPLRIEYPDFGLDFRCKRINERSDPLLPRGAKTAMVIQAVTAMPDDFSVTDLERVCPNVSRDLIRKVLKDLRGKGNVICTGRGPGAKWQRVERP